MIRKHFSVTHRDTHAGVSRRRAGVWPLLCAALLAGAGMPLHADDLFEVRASTVAPSAPLSATETSNDFIAVLKDIGDTRSKLQGFGNTAFTGRVDYAGVANAINFRLSVIKFDPNGHPLLQTASFVFADGHSPVTFTAANSTDLQAQITRYFRREGTAILSGFESPVSVSDGNPNAASATAASATFNAFGTSTVNRVGASAFDGSFFNPLDVEASAFKAGGFDGYRVSVPVGLSYHVPHVLDDRLSLQLTGLFTYININDADVYQGGLFLGAPIQIIKRHSTSGSPVRAGKNGKDSPGAPGYSRLAWAVTPNGGAVASGSQNFAQGGIIYLGGLASALSYDFTSRLTLTLGDSFTIAEGGSLDVGDYHFQDDTDQVILKNGFSLSYQMNEHVAFEGQALATDFVNSAAIPAYASIAVQTVFNEPLGHSGRTAFVAHIGFLTDQAPDFHSYGGRVSLGVGF